MNPIADVGKLPERKAARSVSGVRRVSQRGPADGTECDRPEEQVSLWEMIPKA